MKRRSGFTIVEIIIVITVISILAGIGIVSYSGMQVRARDAERKADIDTMAAALETYYEQSGRYPSLNTIADVTGGSFISERSDGLRLSPAVLTAPNATSAAAPYYSYQVGSTGITSSLYGYSAFNAANSTCTDETTDGPCTRYELYYMLEQEPGLQITQSKFGN